MGEIDFTRAPLELTLEFLCTLEPLDRLEPQTLLDRIATPQRLAAWLRTRGLIGDHDDVSLDDVVSAVELREAIRALAGLNTGVPVPPGALETLGRIARRLPDGGLAPSVEDLFPVDRALAGILSAVNALMVEGIWPRLKLCRNPACRSAFYDRSRNRSAVWCEMSICGNRAKARTFRMRRAAGQSQDSSRSSSL